MQSYVSQKLHPSSMYCYIPHSFIVYTSSYASSYAPFRRDMPNGGEPCLQWKLIYSLLPICDFNEDTKTSQTAIQSNTAGTVQQQIPEGPLGSASTKAFCRQSHYSLVSHRYPLKLASKDLCLDFMDLLNSVVPCKWPYLYMERWWNCALRVITG